MVRKTFFPKKIDIKQYQHELSLKRTYSLSYPEYEEIFLFQGGRCGICWNKNLKNQPKKVRLLAVDHNHITNKIRGLLCWTCNRAIGMFSDDPELLEAARKWVK